MDKLTAETLTDDDIRALAKQARAERDDLTVSICAWALQGHKDHRETVAEMINVERGL